VLTAISNLAWIKEDMNKFEEAERLFERQLELHNIAQTESTTLALNALGNLAALKVKQSKLVEAEHLLKREVCYRSQLDPDDKDLRIAIEWLSFVRGGCV
jgi:hypothetical protein